MEKDFSDGINSFNPYMNIQAGIDMNEIYKDPMFNPIAQYEQAYIYYRYLCMQMDYKIKCKEYEKLCKISRRKIVNSLPIKNYKNSRFKIYNHFKT